MVGEKSAVGLEDLQVNYCQWGDEGELVIEEVSVLEGEGFEEVLFPMLLPHPQPWRQLQHPDGVGVGVVPSHPAGQQPQ